MKSVKGRCFGANPIICFITKLINRNVAIVHVVGNNLKTKHVWCKEVWDIIDYLVYFYINKDKTPSNVSSTGVFSTSGMHEVSDTP